MLTFRGWPGISKMFGMEKEIRFQNMGSREIYFKMIKTYGKPVGNFHGWPGISEISEMETERLFKNVGSR